MVLTPGLGFRSGLGSGSGLGPGSGLGSSSLVLGLGQVLLLETPLLS